MNRIYRVVFNHTLGVWQAVSEVGKGRKKSKTHKSVQEPGLLGILSRLSGQAVLGSLLLVSTQVMANSLPTGGQVVTGNAAISQNGAVMDITQTTDKTAINWQSFNIGQGNTVNFHQPSASSVALNRVIGSDVSSIQGAINANGQVFLINPNGILFSPTAQVNVGGLVASTLDISTEDFLNGNYSFEGASSNAIINQGNITAANGGYIAMIAAKIENTGTITANAGDVLMGAGSKVTLDMGGPVKIQVEQKAIDALITNGGAIKADGGYIYLTAQAAGDLASTVINNTGIIQAQTLETGENGEIYLMGDMDNDQIQVAGTLDASAPVNGNGGFIETSAAKVDIQPGLQVTTKAENGQTGEWLIDPNDYTIAASGGDITGAQLGTNLASTNVTIQSVDGATSGNGDIFVNDEVTWTSGNTLTLSAIRNIEINSSIDASGGSGGKLVLEYGQGAVAASNTATYTINAPVSLNSGQNFSTKLGSNGTVIDYTVVTDRTGLEGMAAGLGGSYALGGDIDLSGSGWTPVGNSSTKFTGQFDGLGNRISNLTINSPHDFVGLFGIVASSSTVRNVGMENVSITTPGSNNVGGLAGINEGTVINSYMSGSVSGLNYVGGLVGWNLSIMLAGWWDGIYLEKSQIVLQRER
ncbi:MAG: filamentous hemagglutinin N-terminal domain-containing protein [Gammaproteobacteria bacterium]|nr:filamentous hemagglutinin N-terminal domain-containing protein [Gammaproteobacteria bacterium]